MTVRIAHLYETGDPQAKEIADTLVEHFTDREVRLDHFDGSQLPQDFDFSDYQGVIMGAQVRRARLPRYVETIVEDHLDVFENKPTAFYMMSQLGSEEPEDHRHRLKVLLERFLDADPWRPVLIACFVGAGDVLSGGFMMELAGKAVADRRGHEIDPSRDYEYREEASISAFVDLFDARLANFQVGDQSHRPHAL